MSDQPKEKKLVQVKDGKNVKISLLVKENGNLSLNNLQNYFPHAHGLTFCSNLENIAVNISGDELILDPTVNAYDVYSCKSTTGKAEANIGKAKSTRVDKILTSLDTNFAQTKEPKVKKARHLEAGKTDDESLPKSLRIGWLHRNSDKATYVQMKAPIGGVQKINVKKSEQYFVHDIIRLAIDKFSKLGGREILSTSIILLGRFREQFISTFGNYEEGSPKDFWIYCADTNFRLCNSTIYIYSTLIDKSQLSSRILTGSKSNVIKSSLKLAESSKYSLSSGSSLSQHPSTSSEASLSPQLSISSSLPRLLPSLQLDVGEKKIENYQAGLHLSSYTNQHLKKTNHPNSTGSSKTIFTDYEVLSVDDEVNSTQDIKISQPLARTFNSVDLYYRVLKVSSYTGAVSKLELNIKNLYHHVSTTEEPILVPVNEYDPQNDGYPICKISVNNNDILKIDLDDHDNLTYLFPSSPNIIPHSIVIDIFNGTCNERLGLGVIPSCNHHCKPTFTWIHDKQKYASGKDLYWIFLPKNNSVNYEDGLWYCKIQCDLNSFSSSKYTITSNETTKKSSIISTSSDNNVNYNEITDRSIIEIEKKELKITNCLLGSGSQGTVVEGFYGNQKVAVKRFNFMQAKNKYTARELEIAKKINHDNIIKVIGIYIEPNKINLVMEYVEGRNLHERLFEDCAEHELSVVLKNKIAKQLCDAINHLHERKNPIIHRDIKPSNIIVTNDWVVKLCDFTLSTFKYMSTTLMSTCNKYSDTGTLPFMAPELILDKKDATIFSDVWSLGCSLVQLFRQAEVWELDDLTNVRGTLEEYFKSKRIPNLVNVPNESHKHLKQCFDYNPLARPRAKHLLFMYNSIM